MRRALLLLVLLVAAPANAARFRVTFINIGEPAPFWDMFAGAIAAAAEDLDVDLEILNAHGDHLRMIELARQVGARPLKPDYILVNGEKGTGERMLDAATGAGVKTMLIMSTLDDADARRYGRPRERNANYLGTLRPDNERAGYDLARAMISAARRFPSPVRLLAISGIKATRPAADRDRGLKRALDGEGGIALGQLVHSEWQREKARRQMEGLLRRWSDTRVVWAANDPMALGTMDAALARGLVPGRDILVGGLNGSIPALERVQRGELVASVGGHFLGGAWALVLLRDYHDGIDFAGDGGGVEVVFPMAVIDRTNVDEYLARFGDQRWGKIDFRRFSKSLNPKLRSYEFTLQRVLELPRGLPDLPER